MRGLAILFALVAGAPDGLAQSPQRRRPTARARDRAAPGRRHPRGDRHLQGGPRASRRIERTRCRTSARPTSGSGSSTTAIQQYPRGDQGRPGESAIRLNLALAYYKSARPQLAIPELKRVVASEPEAKNAYLMLADCYLQTGQDQEVVALLQPREQMFEQRSRLCLSARHGAAAHGRCRRRAEIRRSRVRGRRVGRGAAAHGHGVPRPAGLSFGEDGARACRQAQPEGATAQSLYGRALLALGEQADAPSARSGASSKSTSTTSRPTCSSATSAQRAAAREASTLPRARASRSGRTTSRRASCSRACGCRPARSRRPSACSRRSSRTRRS